MLVHVVFYPERTPDNSSPRLGSATTGLEVMVYHRPVSQDVDVIPRLIDCHQLPMLAVHAPACC